MENRQIILIVDDTIENLRVLDIVMPGMGGYEVCHNLKADPDFNLFHCTISGR